MLKIVNRNCAGIDVHKKIIVVTIAKTNEHDITDYQTKSFNTFIDDKHPCFQAGLTPRCNEFAKKKKSVRITKAGIYIKPLLVQCVLCAIKDKSCPYIKARYESLKRRRGHKKAIIAIARLLLTSIYHILLSGEIFDYKRFENLMNKNFKSYKNIQNTPEEMISYLTNLGYNITLQNT